MTRPIGSLPPRRRPNRDQLVRARALKLQGEHRRQVDGLSSVPLDPASARAELERLVAEREAFGRRLDTGPSPGEHIAKVPVILSVTDEERIRELDRLIYKLKRRGRMQGWLPKSEAA